MKLAKLAYLVVAVLFLGAAPLFAQTPKQDLPNPPNTPVFSGKAFGGGLGMALTIIGAGYGLGRIGSAAMEGMARQPEVAPRIQTAMIIIAAMLEGATLASVILSFLVGNGASF
jgi:F-type H+-transporting ATPase subunit c